MKTLTGAIFLLLAEQAYSHAHMIPFPNHIKASEVLVPVSAVSVVISLFFLIWGVWADSAATKTVGKGPVTNMEVERAEANKESSK